MTVDEAKTLLKANGYVVRSQRSERALERAHWQAIGRAEWAEKDHASVTAWARGVCAEEHRLRDRCTYLYGLAASLGATEEQLHRPTPAVREG